MLEGIKRDRRVIVILISHNMGDIARMADRVVVLDKGRVVLAGSPAEVFAHEEFLRSIGLGLPPVTELMRSLRLGGVHAEGSPLHIDEAEELLDRYLKERNAR